MRKRSRSPIAGPGFPPPPFRCNRICFPDAGLHPSRYQRDFAWPDIFKINQADFVYKNEKYKFYQKANLALHELRELTKNAENLPDPARTYWLAKTLDITEKDKEIALGTFDKAGLLQIGHATKVAKKLKELDTQKKEKKEPKPGTKVEENVRPKNLDEKKNLRKHLRENRVSSDHVSFERVKKKAVPKRKGRWSHSSCLNRNPSR